MHLALETCQQIENPPEDEDLLSESATKRGCRVTRAVWDDPAVDWTEFDTLLLRSTWDYHQKIDAFRAWLKHIEQSEVQLYNSVSTVLWNLDKSYLADLENAGIAIPQTCFIEDMSALDSAIEAIQSEELVVKPTISATAWRTLRLQRQNRAEIHAAAGEILAASSVLLQPFLPEIADGEWSLLFFGGEFSHAVIKKPRLDDFRVQSDFGGTYSSVQAEPWIVAAAERALATVSPTPLYARIDGVLSKVGAHEKFLLMELELIEPDLMLSYAPGSAEKLINALLRHANSE